MSLKIDKFLPGIFDTNDLISMDSSDLITTIC